MRTVTLAKQSDGINLLRSKGGASDSSLFDLVNGWVSPKGTINARPGTRKVLSFPDGTIGVVGHLGKFHTFASRNIASIDSRVIVDVLLHPTGGTAGLVKIHNAFAQLGRLYVVAEFADGVVQHYWLDLPADWTANTILSYSARVQPTATKAGFYFRAVNIPTAPAWTASTAKVVGNSVQPTVANGFVYTATAVYTQGTIVRTSNTEPAWPTTDLATITERRYFTELGVGPGDPTPPTPGTPSSAPGDYGPYPPTKTGPKTPSGGTSL